MKGYGEVSRRGRNQSGGTLAVSGVQAGAEVDRVHWCSRDVTMTFSFFHSFHSFSVLRRSWRRSSPFLKTDSSMFLCQPEGYFFQRLAYCCICVGDC